MSLAVTVLGCSGVYQSRESAASGYLVEVDGERWLLDAGGGTWRNLLQHMDYRDLRGVVLSHRHPDHTIDIWQLFHALQYGDIEAPAPAIPLWAPQETIDRLLGFDPGLAEGFDLKPVTVDSVITFGEARVSFGRMKHPPVTLGARIELNGSIFAYSADTGLEGDFESTARDADVFVCEATAQNSEEPWWGHLCAADAGSIAARLGVRKLVLAHIRPGSDRQLSLAEARATAADIEVELASDGLRLEVGR
ncbi:MAG: MBL fold metallo-hydrolase [Actinomycetota bacterium]|nr:MBL fold metallo-hydrolase [Actinomycetota bacterium]